MKFITFKKEVTISDLLLLAGVGIVMATDHYRIGRLEEDTNRLAKSVTQTDASLSSLAQSCHETAGKVDQLAQFVNNRPLPRSSMENSP